MNNLTSASFNLRKLTKSMDLKSQSLTKDSFNVSSKLASLNAVNRSIKYNDLSFITGQELCKLRRDPQQSLENPQFSSAQGNMFNIRKRYDKKNQEKLYLQNKTQRLQEDIARYTKIENQLLDGIKQGKNKVQKLQTQLEARNKQMEDKQYEKKSMMQIVSIIQHDKIVYDKRKFDMQVYLTKIHNQLLSIKKKDMNHLEQSDRTIKVYQKLVSHIDQEQKNRKKHVNAIQSMISGKQAINNSTILRKGQMSQIAIQAMTDRSTQEKQWEKIYLTHKLLSNFLLTKMQNEMQKFNIVETAFKNIKTATGVNDSKTFVSKFLKKQENYGDLLGKIAQNQKIIMQLKLERDQHTKSIKINQEQINLFQNIKVQHFNFSSQLKIAGHLQQKSKNCQFSQQKLRLWLAKNIKKITSQKNQPIQVGRSKFQILQKFKTYLQIIQTLISDSESEIAPEKQANAQCFNQEDRQKLFRIKPFINVLDQYKQEFQEEYIPNLNQQTDAIQGHRHWIIKNNQKYMKQIKQKREQTKKLIVQSLVKNSKDKVVSQKVKKVQIPVSIE